MDLNQSSSGNLGLGIDTGGTYTDAVIIDMENGTVMSKAKALTTRNDLAEGISHAIDMLDHALFERVRLLGISSTLATNAVVEGKGCRVGLIVIGHEAGRNIPVEEVVQVSGGHNLQGLQEAVLGREAAREFILEVKDRVDAFAISSYLSIRNPEHEAEIKRMVQSLTSCPVVCGHELASALGFHERTITAVLNARLIPIISDLIASIKQVQERMDLRAPLMIVRGDGALMSEEVARERPVETILSGPAASIIGAKVLTSLQDAIIVDVGGTTTDIGILRNGKPHLDSEGAVLGGWRTRVRAVDVFTSGIGGDSRVVVAGGKVQLSPSRAVPLCIAASSHPIIKEKLKALQSARPRPVSMLSDLGLVPQATEFFLFSKDVPGVDMGPEHRRALELIRGEPCSVFELAGMMSIHPSSLNMRKMEVIGQVQRVGLTPTDILHAEGSYVEYDAEASRLAVELQARQMNISSQELIERVKRAVVEKITIEVMKKLIFEQVGDLPIGGVAEYLMDNMVRGTGRLDVACKLELNKPIIGIGAPVGAYLPGVAERFHTQLVLPEHSEIGNAAGAISGNIMETVHMLIRPKRGVSTVENPPCTLFWMQERRDFETMEEGVEYAKRVGSELVRERALASGADAVEIIVENKREEARLDQGHGATVILDVDILITAVGKPRLFREL